MELLRLKDVQLTVQERIFRESAFVQFLAGSLFAGFVVGMFIWNRFGDLPFFAFVLSGGFLSIFSVVFFRQFAKAMAPTNWLLAIGPSRIFIKFRSYLNPHLPEDDPQVVSLSFSEIEAAQITKEKIISHGSRGNSKTTECLTHLDLFIKTESLNPLQERLKYERSVKAFKDYGILKSSTKVRHYPVSVREDKTIRIRWQGSSSFVRPGVKKAADLLARNNITIKPLQRKVSDFTKKATEDGVKAEDKILELAERGKILAATRLAKRVYNYDTTEAKKFVDSLLE